MRKTITVNTYLRQVTGEFNLPVKVELSAGA